MGNKEQKHPVFSRIAISAGIVLVALIGLEAFQATAKKNQIKSEIDSLRAEAERISGENKKVEEKIAYFESKDYQEKEAKDKLNMQGQDENVIVVKPSISKEAIDTPAPDNSVPAVAENSEDASNVVKWWRYLFGKQ